MIYAFGDFELDEERYELRRAGAPLRLEPKAFRVLVYLIRHRERVVTRDELLEQFWSGEFVTESALAHCIVKARQAVGASVARPATKEPTPTSTRITQPATSAPGSSRGRACKPVSTPLTGRSPSAGSCIGRS